MTRRKPFVFDSHALLKLFQKEKGYEKVAALLGRIEREGTAKYVNAINLGEILYSTKREFGDSKKIEVLASTARMGFTILPATNDLIFQAAEFKGQYGISYADCFVLASAVEIGAIVVTGDPEFSKVEHLIEVYWV